LYRTVSILTDKITGYRPVEADILVEQVVCRSLYQQCVVLHKFFTDPGIYQCHVGILIEYACFLPQAGKTFSMELEFMG
jgi:hypothetical protein